MKSFVAYPDEIKSSIGSAISSNIFSGKVLAHVELYKRIGHLKGSVVKCGINSEIGYLHFAELTSIIAKGASDKIIAFEKTQKSLYFDGSDEGLGELNYKTVPTAIDAADMVKKHSKASHKVEFIPGNVNDSIPKYLVDNPDLRISFLVIDLDDYESTLTTLQIFYPRLVPGGVLVFDNYHKEEEDYLAALDYFRSNSNAIHQFSLNKETFYLVRH